MRITEEIKKNIIKDISDSKLSTKEITTKYIISYATFFRIKKEYLTNEKSQKETEESDNEENENESNKESDNEETESRVVYIE